MYTTELVIAWGDDEQYEANEVVIPKAVFSCAVSDNLRNRREILANEELIQGLRLSGRPGIT